MLRERYASVPRTSAVMQVQERRVQEPAGSIALVDRIWERHRVKTRDDGQDLLFIDRHYVHDVTATAFDMLRERGLKPRSPARIVGIADHYVPTHSRDMTAVNHPERRTMLEALARDTAASGIPCSDCLTRGRALCTSSGSNRA